ncbi:MAG: hypothetical protein QXF76_02350 [Candidatus Anstonellales archaeon]
MKISSILKFLIIFVYLFLQSYFASVTLSKANITCCDYFETIITVKDPYGREAENVAIKVYVLTAEGVKKDLSKYPFFTDKSGKVKILYKPLPGEALKIEIDEPWLSYSATLPVKVPDKTRENLAILVVGSVLGLIILFFLIKTLKIRYHINLLLTSIKKKMDLMKKKKQEQQFGLGTTDKQKAQQKQLPNKASTSWVYTTKSVTKKASLQTQKPFGKR